MELLTTRVEDEKQNVRRELSLRFFWLTSTEKSASHNLNNEDKNLVAKKANL